MKKLKLVTFLLVVIGALSLFMANPVSANGGGLTVDFENTGLDPIELPTFLNLSEIRNFSIFSYVAVLLNLVFIGLVIVWVYMAIRAGYERLSAEDNSDQVATSSKRFIRVFQSISMLFVFFIVIILASSFLGFGNLFDWPREFSLCEGGTYYFTARLELAGAGRESDNAAVDRACFTSSGALDLCSVVRVNCMNGCSSGGSAASCQSQCRQAELICINSVN